MKKISNCLYLENRKSNIFINEPYWSKILLLLISKASIKQSNIVFVQRFSNSQNVNSSLSVFTGGPLYPKDSLRNSVHLEQESRPKCIRWIRQETSSKLSNYGSNVLRLEDRDIYNKQNTKFNIITMRPN